jgi:hypothetical protein
MTPAQIRARATPIRPCAALVLLLAALMGWPAGSQANSEKGIPSVTTGGIGRVHGTSVELDGTVDPHGLETTYYFVYGPTEGYGYQSPPQTLEAKNEHIKVGVTVNDFPSGYHYRLVAENKEGSRLGHDRKYGSTGTLKFSLQGPLTPIVYHHALTISGKLVGQDDERVTVELQETPYPFLEAFSNLGITTQTGPGGAFSFHVASLSETGKFRVLAKEPRPIYSTILTQLVTPHVMLKVQKTSVKGLVRLFGTISPAEAGARVLLQVDEPTRPGNSEASSERTSRYATQFSTISRRGTRSMSRFSVIVEVTRAGAYRAYVDLHKGSLAAGSSGTVKLLAGSSKRRNVR